MKGTFPNRKMPGNVNKTSATSKGMMMTNQQAKFGDKTNNHHGLGGNSELIIFDIQLPTSRISST